MFKSSRECLQRVQDQQQLPALVNSCFKEAFLPVPKCADAVPSHDLFDATCAQVFDAIC